MDSASVLLTALLVTKRAMRRLSEWLRRCCAFVSEYRNCCSRRWWRLIRSRWFRLFTGIVRLSLWFSCCTLSRLMSNSARPSPELVPDDASMWTVACGSGIGGMARDLLRSCCREALDPLLLAIDESSLTYSFAISIIEVK